MPADELATQVEAACTEADSVSVWLPEHLAKTHESTADGEAIVEEASDRFRSTLESIDPPDDLRAPLEALEEEPAASAGSVSAIKASLRKKIGLYREIGATRCAKELGASILVLGGTSVEGAFRREGVSLPPRPAGW